MRALFVTPQFEKDVLKIPREIRKRADTIIQRLRINPFDSLLNVKKLNEIHRGAYRVRIGRYRLIYSFSKDSLTLHRFRHRKDVYRNL